MKRKILCAFLAGLLAFACVGCQTKPKNVIKTSGKARILSLAVDYRHNPVGIDSTTPLFSWKMNDAARGQKQTAYQITVADSYERLLAGDYNVWDSGKVESDTSVAVPYGGAALAPSTRYFWQVQVWDKDGKNCLSEEEAFFETGMMGDLGGALWVSQEKPGGATAGAAIVRKKFKLAQSAKNIAFARVYATAAGLYTLSLNGARVGDDFLTPGSTQYDQHILYQTYDVTESLRNGENTLSAQLGNGWWAGMAGLVFYKPYPSFLCKTLIRYENGETQTLVTDGTWEFTLNGPVTQNDVYNGETYAATRLEKEFKYSPVRAVTSEELGVGEVTSQIGESIACMEKVEPVAVTQPKEDVYVFDFGQNLAGVCEITVKAPRATTVTLRHGEMLNNGQTNADGEPGTLYTANLRAAQATDRYVCAGNGEETWHPDFTFHGFRYVEVSGLKWEEIVSIRALVLYTAMDDTSTLTTSDARVNRLNSNVYWGMRSNFLSVPTDCPQRNERFGYLGDAQIFCGTSMIYMDTAAFYRQYITDILDCTLNNGAFPNSAPGAYKTENQQAHGGWADGGIIIPYTHYVRYGDIDTLKACYPAMQTYIEYMKREAGSDYIRDNMGQYGDWLNVNDPTPVGVCDTAYCAYTSSLMVRIALALGHPDDAAAYEKLAQNYKDAWVKAYLNADGTTSCGSQTSYVLALAYDLVPAERKPAVAAHLADAIRKNGNKLSVGFLGVENLLPVLTDNGYADLAYTLLLQDQFPSWLYEVDQGATTIWERWDGLYNNTFQDTGMNSFNHFAFGAVMEWGYAYMAGIKWDEASPAYQHFFLQPSIGGLTEVSATYDSMYGEISSAWKKENGQVTYTCTVPANTTATLTLPCDSLPAEDGICDVTTANGITTATLLAGTYTFTFAG